MFSSLFERISKIVTGVWDRVLGFLETEEELTELEVFDAERPSVDLSPAEIYDIALEEAQEEREEAIADDDYIAEYEAEEAIAEIEEAPLFIEPEIKPELRDNFPSWISDIEVDVLIEEFGVTSYDDMYEFEKDEWLPGWRGFEAADTPAGEIDDMETFRQMVYDEFGLEDYNIDDQELMTLLMAAANQEQYRNALEAGLEPADIADEMDIEYRMSFESLEYLLGSSMWDFILERPDLFEIYIDEITGEVDVYEVY